jgi:hypothetical protein
MHRPGESQFTTNPNSGGFKTEQYYPWGGPDWLKANGKRNGVESVNANVKRAQFEDLAWAEKRAVRGNSFTYLVGALALVSENLRKMISFFKKRLEMEKGTAKNRRNPSAFWRNGDPIPHLDQSVDPPE